MYSPADVMLFSLLATAIAALPFLLSYVLLSVLLWWISRRRERAFERPAPSFASREYSLAGREMFRMNAQHLDSPRLNAVASAPNSGEKAA